MTAINLASQFGKNLIINPTLDFWQRGTSFAAAANGYQADRFLKSAVGTLVSTISRVSSSPSNGKSLYAMRHEVTTADASVAATDNYIIAQRIEGHNSRLVYNKSAFAKFWVRTNKLGTYHLCLNNLSGRTFLKSFTITQANTWTVVKVRIPKIDTAVGSWQYTTSAGLEFAIALVAGTNFQNATLGSWFNGSSLYASASQVNWGDTIGNYFEMTQIQLHEGVDELPFEALTREIGQELSLCERYYQTVAFEYRGVAFAAGRFLVNVPFRTTMRAAPTISTTGVNITGNFVTINAVFNSGFTTHAQSFSDIGAANTTDSAWNGTIVGNAEL